MSYELDGCCECCGVIPCAQCEKLGERMQYESMMRGTLQVAWIAK